jgi:hypothetical protein
VNLWRTTPEAGASDAPATDVGAQATANDWPDPVPPVLNGLHHVYERAAWAWAGFCRPTAPALDDPECSRPRTPTRTNGWRTRRGLDRARREPGRGRRRRRYARHFANASPYLAEGFRRPRRRTSARPRRPIGRSQSILVRRG